jgi:predicted RNA binding protein YcfA (HicA-like mRNA interferase family)
MSKFPTLSPQALIKILEQRGHILDRVRGSHHIYFHPVSKRRAVAPLHKKDLPKGTLIEILKESGISREELDTLFR